jgi:hypothetical protein
MASSLPFALALVLVTVAACSSGASSPAVVPSSADAASDVEVPVVEADAAAEAAAPPAVPIGTCANTFGKALTAGFGRLDGVVWAVQKPSDTACTLPNSDHVVVQVLVNGAVYRMVVNVKSDRAGVDPAIRVARLPHALPAPAFAEGWHRDAALDYATSLDAHSSSGFAPLSLDEATAAIAGALEVGAPVSVYATSGAGRPDSAHLVHRNAPSRDGAIVVSPTTAPTFLLFHFDQQTF